MNPNRKRRFDPEVFLFTEGPGRAISKYRKNEVVFSQGDSADAVFYIRHGECKVTVVSKQGKAAVVALHGKGDFFGEECLRSLSTRIATVTTMTECVIMRLDKAAMVRVLHDELRFSERFILYLLARNARVQETWSIIFSIRARNVWRGCFS